MILIYPGPLRNSVRAQKPPIPFLAPGEHTMRSVGFMLAFVLMAESAVANETAFDLESRIRRNVCKVLYKEYSLDAYEKCQGVSNQIYCEDVVDQTNLVIIRYNAWIHHCLGLLQSKER
jgi:hypothetical protein